MSQPREYRTAVIEIKLAGGVAMARLRAYYEDETLQLGRTLPSVTWDLDPSTILTEYTKRCAAVQRANPEMSPEQAEKAALLAWVCDMEAVASEGHEPA